MTEHCPFCGTELRETTYGRKHCSNCGIIEEEKESEEGAYTGYIG